MCFYTDQTRECCVYVARVSWLSCIADIRAVDGFVNHIMYVNRFVQQYNKWRDTTNEPDRGL